MSCTAGSWRNNPRLTRAIKYALYKTEVTFTHRDGTVRILTGGVGYMSVRQWHICHPPILPREIYCYDVRIEEKFETL